MTRSRVVFCATVRFDGTDAMTVECDRTSIQPASYIPDPVPARSIRMSSAIAALTPPGPFNQSQPPPMPVTDSVRLGANVRIFQPDLVNLYGCSIGDDTKIGAFVEIQKNASIGARCKVSSHSFVCEGVTIEDEVFVGHGVMFINDRHPRAANPDGSLQTEADWTVESTRICRGASIGSGAVIMAGVTVGEGAMIGAGAVVTMDVAARKLVVGVPARVVGDARSVATKPI